MRRLQRRSRVCVEKMVGSQPPPACCHASHILFYYIEDCSRGVLGEQSIHPSHPIIIFQQFEFKDLAAKPLIPIEVLNLATIDLWPMQLARVKMGLRPKMSAAKMSCRAICFSANLPISKRVYWMALSVRWSKRKAGMYE